MKKENLFEGQKSETVLVSNASVPLALGEEDSFLLKERVSSMLKEDVGALAKIRPLLKNEETLDRSLGEVYIYLADRKRCEKCTGSLSQCPRDKKKGYHLAPFYDKNENRIRYAEAACPYLLEVDKILSQINPCDCTPYVLYSDSSTLLSSLLSGDNIRKQQGLSKAFLFALKDIEEAKNNRKGFAFTTPEGGERLSSSLLRLISYQYAKAGKKVSYIDMRLFYHLFRNGESFYRTYLDYQVALASDVLLLENVNKMGYLEEEYAVKYLIPLLESRKKSGKILYMTYCGMAHASSFLYKGRLTPLTKQRLLFLLEEVCEEYVIHDFDLR